MTVVNWMRWCASAVYSENYFYFLRASRWTLFPSWLTALYSPAADRGQQSCRRTQEESSPPTRAAHFESLGSKSRSFKLQGFSDCLISFTSTDVFNLLRWSGFKYWVHVKFWLDSLWSGLVYFHLNETQMIYPSIIIFLNTDTNDSFVWLFLIIIWSVATFVRHFYLLYGVKFPHITEVNVKETAVNEHHARFIAIFMCKHYTN